jgi:hypothetical protein
LPREFDQRRQLSRPPVVPTSRVGDIRLITLVLIAYYGGPDLIEGLVHDLTGIGLFVVAVILLFLFDGFLGLCGKFGFGRRVRGF